MIDKNKLLELIEYHFSEELLQDSYTVEIVKPTKLLTHTRFDLAFKLLYLKMAEKRAHFSKEMYKEHISALSLGRFYEPGQEDKNSIERFYESFDQTFIDIKYNGFDSFKTLIPLSANGSIANGAHRVASAIYLNKEVSCVKIETSNHIYDYEFFYKRNVPTDLLDIAATKFVEYADNVYIAFVWPTAQGYDKEIEEAIPNIVYRKTIKFTPNGAHNLLSQIYFGEPWIGSSVNNFSGSKGKLVECFKTFDPVRVIAFQAENLDAVLETKERIRQIFNVGKHSIHITDTKKEAERVAKLVFNDNSVHFLNYAQPNKYKSVHVSLEKFKTFRDNNKVCADDIILDSGIVLSIYGLREAADIDYLAADNVTAHYNDEDLECHDEELKHHGVEKQELIYNPKYYFFFNDIKFISFDQLYRMKKSRREPKDEIDCKIMESLIDNNFSKKIKTKIKQNLYYLQVKLRAKTVHYLKGVGMFELVKKVYKAVNK
jgi:hypothetical protein